MEIKECSALMFRSNCPSRELLDQIADKWSMMILAVLAEGPLRFNAIRRGHYAKGIDADAAQA